jgi:hypothetical protein
MMTVGWLEIVREVGGAAEVGNFTIRDQFPTESIIRKTGQKFHDLWHLLKTKGKA